MANKIKQTITNLLPQTESFLCNLLTHPSTPGQERSAMGFLHQQFTQLAVNVEKIPLSNALKDDPDYSSPIDGIDYTDRYNLRISSGPAAGKKLLLNTHVDVVPPSEGQDTPWTPRHTDGKIYARGACDAKGQVATIYLLYAALKALDAPAPAELIAHLVVEEENGGNGALAMARRGEQADACIVLEPSTNKLFIASRGAVWFRLTLTGTAGHSGQAGVTKSALTRARRAMDILERYHADLLAASRGQGLFDNYPNPMPLTFGKCHAGNWPAAAPSLATVEGVLGLLPNKTKEQVCDEMRQALINGDPDFADGDFDLAFTYRHDCSVTAADHPLPQGLLAAAQQSNVPMEIDVMTASCDAWLYNNNLNIPTVIYGPGTLAVAHSKDEHITLTEIAQAATVILMYLMSL